jgi:hypothetical protein
MKTKLTKGIYGVIISLLMVILMTSSTTKTSGGIEEIDSKTLRSLNFGSQRVSLVDIHGEKFVIVQTDKGVSVTKY